MSLIRILSNKLVGNPLLITTTTSGVISSSYFICGNLGAASFGIIPAIQDAHGADLAVATKVELWKWYFDRAKVHMSASVIVSTISFSAAAYFSSSSALRNLLLCTSGLSFAIVPFTTFAMMPINNELISMHNARSLHAGTKELSPEHALLEKRALERLERWNQLHKIRMAFGMGAWIAGFAAFVISV